MQPNNIGSLYRNLSEELIDAEIEEPYLEARLLLANSAHVNPVRIFSHPEDSIDSNTVKNAHADLARRKNGEPIAYITGEKEFWSLSFVVTPDTLIPRPESETVIDTILNNLPDKNQELSILDLGTGSGCLLLSLLSEMPNAKGVGVDISSKACAIARQNSVNLNLENRAEIRHGDWMSNIDEKFDIIVSNPPYIKESEIVLLNQGVKDFEPKLALSGGYDGLVSYKNIIKNSRGHLNPRGFVAVEIAINQAGNISEIFTTYGYKIKKITNDLSNIERCILATLSKS